MGAVAARLSDLVVVTSDNPRSEDPARIIDAIRRGIDSSTTAATGSPHLGITDRRTAIERAIDEAEPGDAVVIAGKGHETYQVVGATAGRVILRRSGARLHLQAQNFPYTAHVRLFRGSLSGRTAQGLAGESVRQHTQLTA